MEERRVIDRDTSREPGAAPSRLPAIHWILGIAFVLRAGLVLAAALATSSPSVYHAPDSGSYVSVAREMATTGRFTDDGEPELLRTPGYPLLLVLGARLGRVEAVTIALQILLSCATVWAVYRISRLVFDDERVARLCALLYAAEPLSIVYTAKLLSETLFAFTLALAMWGMVAYLRNGARWALVGSAVAMAFSVYVRPIVYFVPVIVGIGLAARTLSHSRPSTPPARDGTEDSSPPRLFLDAVLFVVVAMSFVGAWQVRNIVEADYRGFSAIADETAYFYHGASVIAVREGKPYYRVQSELGHDDSSLFESMHPEQKNFTRAERYRWLRREGLNIVLAHPATYAWIHVKGVARLMLDPGGFEYLRLFGAYPVSGGLLGKAVDGRFSSVAATLWKERPGALVLNATLGLVLLGTLALATAGMASRAAWRDAALVALAVFSVFLIVWSGGPQAEGRFRQPVMPFLCILAGKGWMMPTERRKGGETILCPGPGQNPG